MRKLSYTHIEADTSQKLLQTYERTCIWTQSHIKVIRKVKSVDEWTQIITSGGETVYQDVL